MIKASVGFRGVNKKNDVTVVQRLLNLYIARQTVTNLKFLVEDGINGRKTEEAIGVFQGHILGFVYPDRLVSAAGKTLDALKNYRKPEITSAWQNIQTQASSSVKPIKLNKTQNVEIALAANLAKQSVTMSPTQYTDPRKLISRQAMADVYGMITKDKSWLKKSQFYKKYIIPRDIYNAPDYNWINFYDKQKRKVKHFWCNVAMHKHLDAALSSLKKNGLLGELKEFGGSLSIRATRGTLNWSAHSWALAFDLNMTENGLGVTPKLSPEFVKCFTDAGFGWGGNYSRKDGMHFTIAGFDWPRAQPKNF